MKEIDINKTGEIGFDGMPCLFFCSCKLLYSKTTIDFVTAMSRKVTTSYSQEVLRAAFQKFDESPTQPTGKIRYENMILAFTKYGNGHRMTEEEAEDFISQVCLNVGRRLTAVTHHSARLLHSWGKERHLITKITCKCCLTLECTPNHHTEVKRGQ
jgi:hypothetical protein